MTTTLPQATEQDAARMVAARDDIERVITGYLTDREPGFTPVPGLGIALLREPMAPMAYMFEPSLCISARGTKHIVAGGTECAYDEQHFLLTAVGLPTVVEVPGASVKAPYVALQLVLDLDLARGMIAEIDEHGLAVAPSGPGIVTGPVTPDLLDAVARLVRLLDSPREIPVLHGLIHREILIRVLAGPGGERLREMVRVGSQSNRVGRAVSWLREHFAQRMRVEELAALVGMGVSTFHHHFRTITTMSPLQFQKLLRLHEARRLLLGEGVDAATASFNVGYESVTQFNREYRRLFGLPPVRDVKRLRSVRLEAA